MVVSDRELKTKAKEEIQEIVEYTISQLEDYDYDDVLRWDKASISITYYRNKPGTLVYVTEFNHLMKQSDCWKPSYFPADEGVIIQLVVRYSPRRILISVYVTISYSLNKEDRRLLAKGIANNVHKSVYLSDSGQLRVNWHTGDYTEGLDVVGQNLADIILQAAEDIESVLDDYESLAQSVTENHLRSEEWPGWSHSDLLIE
jgi:hypothetical protein